MVNSHPVNAAIFLQTSSILSVWFSTNASKVSVLILDHFNNTYNHHRIAAAMRLVATNIQQSGISTC